MKVLHDIKDFNPSKPVWLTQGTFDGVHIGHQKILKQVISEAKNAGGLSVLLTFYPHPEIFNTDQGCQYTSTHFTGILEENKILISMDGKGRWADNVMIERF